MISQTQIQSQARIGLTYSRCMWKFALSALRAQSSTLSPTGTWDLLMHLLWLKNAIKVNERTDIQVFFFQDHTSKCVLIFRSAALRYNTTH